MIRSSVQVCKRVQPPLGPTLPEQHTVKLVWPNNGQLTDCKGTTQGVVAYLLLVEVFVIFDRHWIT